MTLTDFNYTGATYDALTAEEFEAKVWLEQQDKSFFSAKREWQGDPGSDRPIITLNNLEKEAGDAITVPLLKKLTEDGKYGDETLWDHEEAMVFYNLRCYINQLRHATGTKGRMARKRPAFSTDAAASLAIGRWLAEKLDQMVFDTIYKLYPAHIVALAASGGLAKTERYHPNWYVPVSGGALDGYGADPANEAAVTTEEDQLTDSSAHHFNTTIISDMAAEMRVNNFMPVIENGEEFYLGFIHPYQYKQLRVDTNWNEAMQMAWGEGKKNPLFTGALGYWDGVVLYRHNKVAVGTSENIRRAIFMGGNALVYARAGEAFTNRALWDYENEHRFAIGVINGWMRGDFVSDDANAYVFNQSSMIASTFSPQNLATSA